MNPITTSLIPSSTPLTILSNTTTTSYVSVPQLSESFNNNTNFLLPNNNNHSNLINNNTTNVILSNNSNISSINESSCPIGYTWNGILCINQS